MATATVSASAFGIGKDAVKSALKWKSLQDVVSTMGAVRIEVEVPDGLDVTKPVWCFLLTLEGVKYGLMGLRDSYGDSINFTVIPEK